MAFDKKQQIRGIRIILTVFYGFLLSSILFRYIIHGIVETIRRPTNPFSITMIVLGTIVLIVIALAIYATWFDNALIMLVSAIVLICVFVLTLVFGVIRIINTSHQRVLNPPPIQNDAGKLDSDQLTATDKVTNKSDTYALAEDVTKLIIELVFILFAILATFILQRYVKEKHGKYDAVATVETTKK